MHTYRKIDDRCNDKGPVTAKMCISNIGTQDRSQPNGADPICYIIGWFHCALMELFCQVHYKIAWYPIVCHSFENLIHCNTIQKERKMIRYFQTLTSWEEKNQLEIIFVKILVFEMNIVYAFITLEEPVYFYVLKKNIEIVPVGFTCFLYWKDEKLHFVGEIYFFCSVKDSCSNN